MIKDKKQAMERKGYKMNVIKIKTIVMGNNTEETAQVVWFTHGGKVGITSIQ